MTPRGAVYDPEVGYTSRLPNPRLISSAFHAAPRNVTDPARTHMFMQFGQFIDHDVAGFAKPDFDCCAGDARNLCPCFPIDLSADETLKNRTCMLFTRSSVSCR